MKADAIKGPKIKMNVKESVSESSGIIDSKLIDINSSLNILERLADSITNQLMYEPNVCTSLNVNSECKVLFSELDYINTRIIETSETLERIQRILSDHLSGIKLVQ